MTTQTPKKMHGSARFWASIWFAWMVGVFEALLLARLLLRLLAARPDNPTFGLIYAISEPLVAPLAWLNQGQPPFGASLEFSTLILASIVPVLGYLIWVLLRRATTVGSASS